MVARLLRRLGSRVRQTQEARHCPEVVGLVEPTVAPDFVEVAEPTADRPVGVPIVLVLVRVDLRWVVPVGGLGVLVVVRVRRRWVVPIGRVAVRGRCVGVPIAPVVARVDPR